MTTLGTVAGRAQGVNHLIERSFNATAAGAPAAEDLAKRLHLRPDGVDRFVRPARAENGRVFGGLLMAQALGAAAASVDSGRPPHSIHGQFLRAGDERVEVRYEVERTRDGGSFSSRRVVALQDGEAILVATVSFHDPEPGMDYEAPAPKHVPGPEELAPGRYSSPWFESRDVPEDADVTSVAAHTRLAWFRARTPLPADPALQTQAIVFLSDYGATRAVRQAHTRDPRIGDRISVSLDHSVWLHSPAPTDGWLLSEYHPVTTGGSRGLAIGTIRTPTGHLVASMAQEALLRVPPG